MPITLRGSTSSSSYLRMGNGNVLYPGVSFVNAPNTGVYMTQGNIGFSIDGVEKARITSNGLIVSGNVSAGNVILNGNILSAIPETLISSVQVANSTFVVLDDTAVSTNGGYIIVNGSGFLGGSVISVGGTLATSTTILNSTQLGAQIPAKAAGSYTVSIIRPDSVSVNLPLGVTYSPFPVWSTSTNLGDVYQNIAFSRTLAAPSDSTVTYANTTTLPPQTTLAPNGTLSGTMTSVADDTLFSFGIKATDLELQDIPRTFSLQYNLEFVARKLVASDKLASDQFGNSVSMSSDGTRVVVGAYLSDPGGIADAGAAYVFSRSGTTWTQEFKLVASDKVTLDYFGRSVSINTDGTRVVVGAFSSDPGGIADAGAAYVFSRSGTTWTEESKLVASDKAASDLFGQSVSINSDGSRLIVGAYASNPGGTADAGAAYVFSRSGLTWTQESILVASDKVTSDQFGRSVSINSDGSRVVVGAYQSDPGGIADAGAAYVFSRSGTTWTEESKLVASDKAASDLFGHSVSINSDGSRLIVGAYASNPGGTADAGAAYVFSRSGLTWTQEFKLVASDKVTLDYFGSSVSINSDGSRVVVGAYQSDPGGTVDAGAAYVFARSGTTWTQETKLFASDKVMNDQFGRSVSMNSDGTRVIVGASLSNPDGIADAGAAYICGYSIGTWILY